MVWTILLVKQKDNGWFLNYIKSKLLEQINKLNLQNNIEIIISDNLPVIFGNYISIIDEIIDISDNFIESVYNVLKNSTKDYIGLKGKIIIDDNTFIFNNLDYTDNEIFIPITKLNPIKKEIVLNIQNYFSYDNLTSFVKNSDNIDNIVVFKENIKKENISIIITAYKSQNFIEECLDSIINQSYFINNNNFEILVGVDGCAETYNKLSEIKHKYRNLNIYMMAENKGTYVTTNTLIDLTKFENILRFDSDDIMKPDLVKEVFKHKKDNDLLMLGSVDLKDGKIGNEFLITPGIIFFKKSVMNIAGGYRPWLCAADSELISRLKDKIKISKINVALFYRRIHKNSLTSKPETGYGSTLRKEYIKQMNSYKGNIKIIKEVNKIVNKIENKSNLKIAFGMIVFNGDYVLKECLESIYPYATQILIAEGPVSYWQKKGYTTSTDKTNEIIDNFPDPENKISIVHSQYNEKDLQANAYMKFVNPDTDYIWHIDSDELFHSEDIEKIINALEKEKYTTVRFRAYSFFGGFDRFISGYESSLPYVRIKKYYPGSYWSTHRPPTLKHLVKNILPEKPLESSSIGVYMYHYSHVFPDQVYDKIQYYKEFLRPTKVIDNYFNNIYLPWIIGNDNEKLEIEKLYGIDENIKRPSKSEVFGGQHPKAIVDNFKKLKNKFETQLKKYNSTEFKLSLVKNTTTTTTVAPTTTSTTVVPTTTTTLASISANILSKNISQNSKLVSVNMATYPLRKNSFIRCINELLKIDIIDIIRVYLNEYKEIPKEFPSDDKIYYLLGNINLKDTGKFYWASEKHNEYYFTVDDDFLYSNSYFENHLKLLKKYNNKVFVTLHGKVMNDNPIHINDSKSFYRFENDVKEDTWVNYVGTGVMLFDNSLHYFPLETFKYNGMADIFISLYCQKEKIPIIRRKNLKSEVIYLPNKYSLYNKKNEMYNQHLETLRSINAWNLYKHDKKISIVTSYYNRKNLFYETLKSISKTKYSNFEVIVVDDGSDEHERLEDLRMEFSFIRILRIEKENKWYRNPCVPFNIGLKSSKGDIIILQNPECYHMHDILSYAYKNANESNYLSISTYALPKKLTDNFLKNNNKKDFFEKLPQQEFVGETLLGWYNHSIYRPVYYHFCSIMTKNNMNLLGGFDERYAEGIAFDDNEFLERIIRLKLNKIICDDVSVIHLYHDSIYYNMKNYLSYHKKNELMFEITKQEHIINVNNNLPIIKDKQIPKRIFFYWCGDNFSWMRYMTLYSFRKMNPDWEIILYRSYNPNRKKTWTSFEKQDFSKKIEINYFDKLKDLNVKIESVVFPEDVLPYIKDISLIHESDIFRYYELYKNGGIYCDTDVLFFRPIDNFYNMLLENNYDTIFAQGEWVTIGFLGSTKNNELYKDLFESGIYNYKNKIKNDIYDINSYQSMGAELIYKNFNKVNWKNASINSNVLGDIKQKYPYLNIYNLPNSIIYHYDWRTPKEVFSNSYGINTFDSDSIGYHWFGGSDDANKYGSILTENNFYNYKTTFSEIAKSIIQK